MNEYFFAYSCYGHFSSIATDEFGLLRSLYCALYRFTTRWLDHFHKELWYFNYWITFYSFWICSTSWLSVLKAVYEAVNSFDFFYGVGFTLWSIFHHYAHPLWIGFLVQSFPSLVSAENISLAQLVPWAKKWYPFHFKEHLTTWFYFSFLSRSCS